MNEVDVYLDSFNSARRERIEQVINYMRYNYSELEESCNYAPKTKFPVYKTKNGMNYLAIASQKNYISIHFGSYKCTTIVSIIDSRITTGVGCVRIPDSVMFPINEIITAIDLCFSK